MSVFTVFAGCGSALPLDPAMPGTSPGAALLSLPRVYPGASARPGRPSPSPGRWVGVWGSLDALGHSWNSELPLSPHTPVELLLRRVGDSGHSQSKEEKVLPFSPTWGIHLKTHAKKKKGMKTRKKVEGDCPDGPRPTFKFFWCSPATESLIFTAGWKQPCVARVCSAQVKGVPIPVLPWDSHCRAPRVRGGRAVGFGDVDGVLQVHTLVCGNGLET